jgi:hypothetical protein
VLHRRQTPSESLSRRLNAARPARAALHFIRNPNQSSSFWNQTASVKKLIFFPEPESALSFWNQTASVKKLIFFYPEPESVLVFLESNRIGKEADLFPGTRISPRLFGIKPHR